VENPDPRAAESAYEARGRSNPAHLQMRGWPGRRGNRDLTLSSVRG
jgi:hypothetical protein